MPLPVVERTSDSGHVHADSQSITSTTSAQITVTNGPKRANRVMFQTAVGAAVSVMLGDATSQPYELAAGQSTPWINCPDVTQFYAKLKSGSTAVTLAWLLET